MKKKHTDGHLVTTTWHRHNCTDFPTGCSKQKPDSRAFKRLQLSVHMWSTYGRRATVRPKTYVCGICNGIRRGEMCVLYKMHTRKVFKRSTTPYDTKIPSKFHLPQFPFSSSPPDLYIAHLSS